MKKEVEARTQQVYLLIIMLVITFGAVALLLVAYINTADQLQKANEVNKEDVEEYKEESQKYKALYELAIEEYKAYQEEHPDIN